MTTLSLCMIVRDEAALLPEFLSHVQGLADDLCVVDTGSKDNTVALLEAAGARVFHAPWENDFAKARNTCLSHAKGEWVLWLDADEMIDDELRRSIGDVCATPDAGAAAITIRSKLPNGHACISHLVRMCRRDPRIQFRHTIHENITDTLLPVLQEKNLQIVATQGLVEHLGYVREHAGEKNKKERDCTILRAAVEKDPNDLYSWYKLLEQGRFWEDSAMLQDNAAPALAALERGDPAFVKQAHFIGELLVLIAAGKFPEAHKPALLFLYPDAPAEAHAFLQPWEDKIAPSAAYLLRRGELRETLGGEHFQAAARDFDACLGLRGRTPNTQLALTRPLLGLARVALALNETDDALRFLNLALGQNPRDPEALLALATISRGLGGSEATANIAEAYVQSYGDHAELHGALGEAALRAGDHQVAVAELQLAVGDDPHCSPYAGLLDEALLAAL